MNDWTIFYWGWWVAYSPSVGLFTAKISRGRTVGEYIKFTMSIPVIYTFLWMCVFGGAGLRIERDAAIANITCDSVLGGTNSTESFNGLYRLSCRSSDQMWFDVMESYQGIGFLLSILSIGSIILYFVTTSDSASLVTDSLASNGIQYTPVGQRVFWALTQGACATGLLTAGGEEALRALQAASVAAGLPFTFVLCFFYIALWRAFCLESRDKSPDRPEFYLDLVGTLSSPKSAFKCCLALLIPWYFIGTAKSKLEKTSKWLVMILMAGVLYTAITLIILETIVTNLAYVGLAVYIGFVGYCTSIRSEVRSQYGISGNMVEDFFAALLMYPCVTIQIYEHINKTELLKKKDKENMSAMPNRISHL